MTEPEAAPLRPNDWVRGFALLVLCQLAGEATVSLLRLAVPAFAFPGPVAGMLYLLAFLAWRRSGIRAVTAVATGLLGALSLLFVLSGCFIVLDGGEDDDPPDDRPPVIDAGQPCFPGNPPLWLRNPENGLCENFGGTGEPWCPEQTSPRVPPPCRCSCASSSAWPSASPR